MSIGTHLRRQGGLLFRWRSILPLLLLPPALIALMHSDVLEASFGERADDAWMISCLVVSFIGQAWRGLVVGSAPAGTSGRNTRAQRALTLNTTGAYSVSRNPLYFGNLLVIAGFALAIQVWWMTVIVILAFALYYERIIFAEEAYLEERFGESFRIWSAATPLIFPRFSLWKPPALPFSLRIALRREYNGVALILITVPLIDFLRDVIAEGKTPVEWLREDTAWALTAAVGVVLLLVFRAIKRHTRLLQVPGR